MRCEPGLFVCCEPFLESWQCCAGWIWLSRRKPRSESQQQSH